MRLRGGVEMPQEPENPSQNYLECKAAMADTRRQLEELEQDIKDEEVVPKLSTPKPKLKPLHHTPDALSQTPNPKRSTEVSRKAPLSRTARVPCVWFWLRTGL